MLCLRKFIKEEEVMSYITDPTYSKVIFEPKANRKTRDIAIKVFFSFEQSVFCGVLGMIAAHAANPNLPNNVKSFLRKRWDRIKQRGYFTQVNLKELKEIETKYNISFTLPKVLKKYI